jgi:hypothetical protein
MLITNNLNLPKVFENAVNSFQRDYTNTSRFSVTDLLKSPYMQNLERLHHEEITEDVVDRVWALLGSALHEVLKKSNIEKNILIEERLKIIIDGIEISGQFDSFCDNGVLIDYKLTSVWKIMFSDYQDWENQLNIYAYLLYKYNFDVKKIEVVAILKDYSKKEKLRYNNYPKDNIARIELKLWDYEKTESFIKERIQKHLTEINIICNEKDRWHKDDKFAIMKKGRKTAVRVLEDKESAEDMLKTLDDKHYIEIRKGEDERCENYCRVNKWCEYYNNKNKE